MNRVIFVNITLVYLLQPKKKIRDLSIAKYPMKYMYPELDKTTTELNRSVKVMHLRLNNTVFTKFFFHVYVYTNT